VTYEVADFCWQARILAGKARSLEWKARSLAEGDTFKRTTKRVRIDNETVVLDVLTLSKGVVGYKSGQDFRG